VTFRDDAPDAEHWLNIYGLLATSCGYSYPVIDEMTLFQVEELASYWAQHPPLHLLIAAYLGVGKEKHARPPASLKRMQRSSSDVGSVLAHLGPGFSSGDVHAGLSPANLDFAELRRQARAPD
jgi:hypothetical protein